MVAACRKSQQAMFSFMYCTVLVSCTAVAIHQQHGPDPTKRALATRHYQRLLRTQTLSSSNAINMTHQWTKTEVPGTLVSKNILARRSTDNTHTSRHKHEGVSFKFSTLYQEEKQITRQRQANSICDVRGQGNPKTTTYRM